MVVAIIGLLPGPLTVMILPLIETTVPKIALPFTTEGLISGYARVEVPCIIHGFEDVPYVDEPIIRGPGPPIP